MNGKIYKINNLIKMANYNPPNNIEGHKGPGRPAGSKNVATAELREYVKLIVAGQLSYIDESLDRVREKYPDKYLSLLTRLIDMVLPKQQQIEVNNENGIDISKTIQEMKEKLDK